MSDSSRREPGTAAFVDRMYVLDGGEATVEDISPWSPGANEGVPWSMSVNAYLVQHGGDWLLWDTGLDDELVRLPAGEVFAHGVRGVTRRTISSQLQEIGIGPDDVTRIALSHAHFDHVGNSRSFPRARWYVQDTEHAAMFGPDYGDYGFLPELYAGLQGNETQILHGDCDVFGDNSVRIISTPGHTPGHQSLLVRLPVAGPVILSGDVAHFSDNLRHRRVPTFNSDHAATRASMERLCDLVDSDGAHLLINHDAAQSATVRYAPAAIR